ncbi:hypothetical protein YC2023_071575 [Brassica napus]
MTRIKFTTACQDAPDVLSLDFVQPRAVTHGRSAFVPYPREDGGTTICDTQADVPSARRLGVQLAFKDSMVHGILQFTPSIAFCYVLHRCESRDIRCRDYAYDPTNTEVLAKDERITTESAGTVRNRPTESDVSSFSGRSVSRTVNHPRRRDPNTSPDHSIGRSDGRTHTDVRVCPSAHTGRPWPSVSTHRTSGCPSVHISARSVDCSGDFGPRGLSVQYTQDVRQHTEDVRGCPCVSVCPSVHTRRPSAHTGRLSAHAGRPSAHAGRPCVSVCVRVSISTRRISVSTHRTSVSTQRTSVAVRQYTQDVRGCPSAHTGRPSVHTGRPWPSVSTHRTSVSTRRTSVAVCVCPCVRQYTQDVRQYTQDVRQHTQDVRGRPSVHTGRPWSSVSTHISLLALPVDCSGDFGPRGLSVQYTQDVRQHTQDVRACPLAHTDCPWTDPLHISACWPFPWTVRVLIRVLDIYQHADHTYQHAGPSRGLSVMLTIHISILALPVDCPCTDFGQVMHHDAFGRDLCTCGLHFIGQSEILGTCDWKGGGSNLSDKGLNLSGSWQQGHSATYNTPSRRADIEGSKSNVAMNAWLPQASYPCGNFSDTSSFKFQRSKGSIGHAFTMCRPSQTPHLTMSSARIDPPKRVLGLKEGVVTPPPIHGSFHKVGLESSSTGSSLPADSAKPVPLAVVSLDSRQGQWESR